ncbi:hypothetical protein [Saccharothrix yanglingensis]|uniref:hypothetical protein n=1 Tax=Saccharothrix yanglingensis TaxID=659496 RepID=UPI0027D33D4B|nr:hypothetical protein [Saccharothrix yanglingensis]
MVRPAAGIVVVSFDVAFVVLVPGYPAGYRENGPLPLRVTTGGRVRDATVAWEAFRRA